MKRLRLSNDLFVASFILTLTPAMISGMLAASQIFMARAAGNSDWLRTDVSGELKIFAIAGGLAAAILSLRFFAPITWVDLREEREPGGPAWSESGRALPNSEIEPDLTPAEFVKELEEESSGGFSPLLVALALLLPLFAFRYGMRFTERGIALWRWDLGSYHLFGKDWTGVELAVMSLLLVLLAAVCTSGWRRTRSLNR